LRHANPIAQRKFAGQGLSGLGFTIGHGRESLRKNEASADPILAAAPQHKPRVTRCCCDYMPPQGSCNSLFLPAFLARTRAKVIQQYAPLLVRFPLWFVLGGQLFRLQLAAKLLAYLPVSIQKNS
jgi:hypothetical protein